MTAPVSPWQRIYENEGRPVHVPSAEITGSIPARLRGIHLRVGPVSGRAYGQPLGNAFADADGYLCVYRFTDEGVEVRGDVIRTPVLERERAAGRLLTSTFATEAALPALRRIAVGLRGLRSFIPALSAGKPAQVKDSPNHVPCVFDGKAVVVGGAGAPYAVDPVTLAPLGRDSFGGALPPHQVYLVGESHVDPVTGDRCFLEICTYPPGVRLWSVPPRGRGRGSRRIPLPKVYFPHDFGLTETKIVVPAGSVQASLPKLVLATLGIGTMSEAFEWHDNTPTLYYVIDRRTHDVRVFTAPPSYPVHVANAFDDGDDVVLDLNVHNGDAAVRGFTAAIGHDTGYPDFRNRLNRIRLTAGGAVFSEELLPVDCEVPFTSEAREGRRSRYVYAAVTQRGIAGSPRIVKVDAETKRSWTFDYGEGCVTGQPVFVPDLDGAAEDDGWILCHVYDSVADRSFLGILAGDLSREEARVLVPGALPYLLHGKFVHDSL